MENRTQVTVSLRTHKFPTHCARCNGGGVLTSRKIGFDKQKVKDPPKSAEYILPEIPFCQRCATRQSRIVGLGGVMIGLGLFGGIAIGAWLNLGRWISTGIAVILLAPGVLLTDYRDKTVQISAFTSDTITFSFKRADYANQFMKINKVHADAESRLPG